MALHYHGTLPKGALVNCRSETAPAPVWLSARAIDFDVSPDHPDRVLSWRSLTSSDIAAQAVAANKTGTRFHPDPPRLQFDAEANGGLVLADAIPDASALTFGLIFCPDLAEDARTLLSLQVKGSDDYLFLSGEAGAFRIAEKDGQLELSLPASGSEAKARLLLCSVSGTSIRLCADLGPSVSAQLGTSFAGRADLFVGCRNARAGLRRKLGRFGLTDVLVWPGQDLLSVPDDPALALVKSLWQDRCNHGL